MSIDYVTAQKRFRAFKSALTRAINSKDPHKVIRETERFFAYYVRSDTEPAPDDWARWARAADDAQYAIQRAKPYVL